MAQLAIKYLKKASTEAPVLALPYVEKAFDMIRDASGFDCGAMLKQTDRAIAYYSN